LRLSGHAACTEILRFGTETSCKLE
jgi:hypothetical protein